MIYELFIEYSNRLYRICKPEKTVDNSKKTDGLPSGLWITVWTVWKCMRLCTPLKENEYSRMGAGPRKKCRNAGDCAVHAKKQVYA